MVSTGKNNGSCENCGRSDEELAAVRRVYVRVDPEGRVSGEETVSEAERWCLSCRSLYPHEPGSGGPGSGANEPSAGAEES